MNVPKKISFDAASVAPQPSSTEPSSPPPQDAQVEGPASFLPEDEAYEGLRGKFKSAEDLAKSYLELERRLGSASKTGDSTTPEAPSGGTPNPQQTTGGLSLDAYEREYQEKGQLAPESYSKLQQAGYPREMVDQYIAGRQALVQQQMTEVLTDSGVGTLERYHELSKWASQNVPKDELQAINQALGGKDLGAIKVALNNLNQRYSRANGSPPSLLGGKLASGPAVEPYESNEQVVADMRKPEYKSDPAFRRKVEKRLAASNVLNSGYVKR